MSRVVCSMAGSLMGDAWMKVPAVRDICAKHEVWLVAGTYTVEVWNWARENVRGMEDLRIVHTLDDADDRKNPLCPGFGYPALNEALRRTKELYPGETVLGDAEIGSYYHIQKHANLELRKLSVVDGAHTSVHYYTRHEWKNCCGVVAKVRYNRPALPVGIKGEPTVPGETMGEKSFDRMVQEVLQCRGFVGVLSSWLNLAFLFRKLAVAVSFTPDIPTDSPRAIKLVKPSVEELQVVVDQEGL